MSSRILFPNFFKSRGGGSDNSIRQPEVIYDFIFDYNNLSDVAPISYPDKFIDDSPNLALEIVTSSIKIKNKDYRISLKISEFDYRIFPIKSFEEIQTNLSYEWYVDGVLEQTNTTNEETFELVSEYIGKDIQTKIINTQTSEEWLSNIISVDYILNISLNNIVNLNFQNGDKVSRYGLNQSEADTLYAGTNLDGIEIVNNGVQRYQIPETTSYRFECFGAKGGGNYGGKGAYISGIFRLKKGDYIQVGCGNQGTWDQDEASGGGASWVAKELSDGSLDLLLIAGGGGGSADNQADSAGGSISINGNKSVTNNNNNHPGVNGSGGEDYSSNARNGSGWYFGSNYQPAIKDNPRGGDHDLDGGFGGGGACRRYYDYVSGGGGYSGGEGGRYGSQIGGGGGSFNKGNFQENIPNYNDGHGKVNCEYYSSTIDDYFDIISTPELSKQIIGDALFLVTNFEFEHFELFNLRIQDLDTSYKWFKDGVEITNDSYVYELDLINDINSIFYVEITNNKKGNIYTTNTLIVDSSDSDFDILKLKGVNLYLDANDDNSLTIDGSNNVSEWTDLISGNVAEQADTVLQPLKQVDSWNTHNTVYFSNDQQLIINPNFQTQNNYWFFLIKLETSHPNIAVAGSDNNTYISIGGSGSSDDNYIRYISINNPKRTSLKFTGNNVSISNRDNLYDQLTVTEGLIYEVQNFPAISNNVSLGSSNGSTSWYANGEFQAIACINGDYKNVDYIANQIVGLLAHRVGIEANLPTNHPYKSTPPSLTNGQTDSATIEQNNNKVDISNLSYHVFVNENLENLINKRYVSIKWFMDGVEVVGKKESTLHLDENNGDQGKDVHLQVTDFNNNIFTSNTITIQEITLWQPNMLSSLSLWLDASDESTITKDSNDKVSQWNDISSNTYLAEVLNGDVTFENSPNCVSFNGTGYYRSPTIFSQTSLPSMILATVMQTNNTEDNARYGFGSYNYDRDVPSFNPAGDSTIRFDNGYLGGSISINSNEYIIRLTKLDGTIILDRINGSENINSNSSRIFNHNKLSLGEIRSSSNTTKFSEVVVTESISQDVIEKLEGYLAHKWNLTDKLPTNHPYKNTAP